MSDQLDCGDSSCLYAINKTGVRTNGGCRCEREFEQWGGNDTGWCIKKADVRKLLRNARKQQQHSADKRLANILSEILETELLDDGEIYGLVVSVRDRALSRLTPTPPPQEED